jgi:hypothetical protein
VRDLEGNIRIDGHGLENDAGVTVEENIMKSCECLVPEK